MAAIVDFPTDGLEACIMRNRHIIIFAIVLDLKLEAPEILPVNAFILNLAGPEISLHDVAGIIQRGLGIIMVSPILAALEAFC